MTTSKLALVGFGNVGRAFARLFLAKQERLRSVYGVEGSIVAIFTARHGSVLDPAGINLPQALSRYEAGRSLEGLGEKACGEIFKESLRESQAQMILETTPLNSATGEPAISYLTTALELGLGAVTANKGAVVFGFERLTQLAQRRGQRFLFEATVLDGAPVFSLFREVLPATRLLAFRGILNSTTNFILTEMENGKSLEQAVREAQQRGIAEADPAADLDGWDAAFKVSILARVLMGQNLLPAQIERQGIGRLSGEDVRRARAEGRPVKLVCSAELGPQGLHASVRPEQIPLSDPLASIAGTSSCLQLRMDTLSGLTITEHDPSPATTAFGLLADWLRIATPDFHPTGR